MTIYPNSPCARCDEPAVRRSGRKTDEQEAELEPASKGEWYWQATESQRCRVSGARAGRLMAAGEKVWPVGKTAWTPGGEE